MELPTVEAERLQRWLGTEPGVRQPKRRCERATRSRTVCRTLRRMYYVSASDLWVQELSFARHGFEMFHDMCRGSSDEDLIRNSSAGIRGWAQFGKGLLVPSEQCKQFLTTPSVALAVPSWRGGGTSKQSAPRTADNDTDVSNEGATGPMSDGRLSVQPVKVQCDKYPVEDPEKRGPSPRQ